MLGIHFTYDGKGNDKLDFNQKIQKLETKLDMRSSRHRPVDNIRKSSDTNSLGSQHHMQLVYSAASNWPCSSSGNGGFSENKLVYRFLGRNKKDKIKRSDLYQDPDREGIRMADTNITFKALKLAKIPRLD